MRGSPTLTAFALLSLATSAHAQEWTWSEVLSSPRIGERFSAVAVDPNDPLLVLVGTEEGTLLVSEDGGVSFDERPLHPATPLERSVGLAGPEAPSAYRALTREYRVAFDPPFSERPSARVSIPFETHFFGIRPSYVRPEVFPSPTTPEVTFLQESVQSRVDETEPVVAVASCPDNALRVVAATSRTLYGSEDGRVFSPIFELPGVTLFDVRCAPVAPGFLALTTSDGLWLSVDGGRTLDAAPMNRPGTAATAVAFGPEGRFLVAFGGRIHLCEADRRGIRELDKTYVDGSVRSAAYDVDGRTTWLATDLGLRVVRVDGLYAEEAALPFFAGLDVQQVVLAASGELVALARSCPREGRCRTSHVFRSNDGERWEALFEGATRRNVTALAVPAPRRVESARASSLWLVTGGELWVSAAESSQAHAEASWARARLDATPRLDQVLDDALDAAVLTPEELEEVLDASRRRAFVPRLEARFDFFQERDEDAESQRIMDVAERDARIVPRGFVLFVQATWNFGDAANGREVDAVERAAVYEVQRQLAFAIEDGWHERRRLLDRLARGVPDRLVAETIRIRVEIIEALLAAWTGEATDLSEGS